MVILRAGWPQTKYIGRGHGHIAIYLQILYDFISTLNRIGPSLASPLTIATPNGAISLNQ